MRKILIAVLTLATSGCAHTWNLETPGTRESGYTYVPIDPFPVPISPDTKTCPTNNGKDLQTWWESLVFQPLLESLPDNAVRMSIEQFDNSGNIKYGPGGIGAKGESYKVIVDYVNSDTTNFRVRIAKAATNKNTGKRDLLDLISPVDENKYDINSISYEVRSLGPQRILGLIETTAPPEPGYHDYNIPVYVGIGLRVTANVDVVGENANISGLGIIGAEAESNTIKGSLVVQTLGINGKSIASALPIQSELNRTTAQNAIVAVGSIKALLYDPKTATAPRIVGMYLPFPAGKPLVNAIISEMSRDQAIAWVRPCITRNQSSSSPHQAPDAPTSDGT